MEQSVYKCDLIDAIVRFAILVLCFLFGFFLNSIES